MNKRNGIYLLLLLVILNTVSAFSAGVRMSVENGRGRRSIEVGELFYISIEISDIDANPQTPSNVPGAKVIYFDRTGQTSRFYSENGRTTQSFSSIWTLTLRATKEGSFTFGPITVGGAKSNAVTYTIGKAQSQPAVPGGQNSGSAMPDQSSQDDKPKFIGKGDGNLFMRANVSKTSVYEQEALVYTVKLYTTYDAIKFIGATATPKFEGFIVEESKDISTSLSYETYNGKTYATAVIARYIIFPQMPGNLKVIGNTYTVSVDRREYFHDPFYGSLSFSTPLQLNVTPNDLSVSVKALPQPKPADFSGGVGQFSISSSLPKEKLLTNQAASVIYTVSGSGNLKYISLPDLNVIYPDEIEVYSPKTDINTSVGSSNVSGSVKFDYSFMPLEEGEFTIPEIKLVYFNPVSAKYETSVAKGFNLTVGKGNASAKSQSKGNLKFDSELMPYSGELKKSHKNYVDRFSYWLWFIVPMMLLCGALIYRRMYINRHADMIDFNSRRADKLARKRLKKAYDCMRKNDSEHFYDEILIALWGYLGDKLKMPTSELMRDNIKSVLMAKNINEDDISRLLELLDNCEFAKYSSSDAELDMPQIYNKSIEIINLLEKSFKSKK